MERGGKRRCPEVPAQGAGKAVEAEDGTVLLNKVRIVEGMGSNEFYLAAGRGCGCSEWMGARERCGWTSGREDSCFARLGQPAVTVTVSKLGTRRLVKEPDRGQGCGPLSGKGCPVPLDLSLFLSINSKRCTVANRRHQLTHTHTITRRRGGN